jgi:hypothetical protein
MLLGIVAGLLAIVALVSAGIAVVAPAPQPTAVALDLAPESELDRSWGTYLSEREWGTPREAVGANGWGLTWTSAITTDYRFGDDGIAGIADAENQYRLAWAFWDGAEDHVTERFNGYSNPAGPNGEAIIDDRVHRENGLGHAYTRMTYRYPSETKWFSIDLESARYDSHSLTMAATVTNTTSDTRVVDVIFKAWTPPSGTAEPLTDGVVLSATDSVVAVVGQKPSEWQISADKGAIDANLREGGLTGDEGGHIGALAYRLELPAGAQSVIRIGVAQVAVEEGQPIDAATDLARRTASERLARSDAIVQTRRAETATTFSGQVTEHEDLYRRALMGLMWNETFYRWDGTSQVSTSYAGQIDARDVLILPDKWEYPWVASWDQAFHAVSASLVDADIAADQLRFVLSDRWQQPDGHIPCGEWVMAEECPPIFAWAAWRVYEESRDIEFLRDIYPGLQRSYDYWWLNKQVGAGLFTGGFLGMDNLPRGGPGSAQADATAWMALFARDMARIGSELQDPETSERYWVDRGVIQEALNDELWDEGSGFYYDLAADDSFIAHKSYSGLVPLIAGVVPPERLPRLLNALRDEDEFMSVGGIRSMSRASSLYLPGTAGHGVNSNWRGPVWVPINYMLVEALRDVDPSLAAQIRDRVVGNVEADWQATERFHEFFDGDTGKGQGADAQTGWTALVANLIHESWPAPTSAE